MRLSRRTAWVEQPSPLHEALERLRTRGHDLVDLTCSNPTRAGFHHPQSVYDSLRGSGAQVYEPHALGLPAARRAVAEHYGRRGVTVSPEQVWLCASTSEAYAHLFALLCDPDDAVLVPRPGYPLLDVLGDVTGVRRVPYPLAYDGRWHVDMGGLRRALHDEPRVRAIVAVAPNNPTGNYLSAPELAALEAICVEHDLPLVVDEVFADYPLAPARDAVPHVHTHGCTSLVLSGLSKVAALPQMKLSWIVVHGPPEPSRALLARAEHLADAFLSVASPVQRALPQLLAAAQPMQDSIRARLRDGFHHLRTRTETEPVELLATEGGWTALLRLPRIDGRDAEGWALELLEHAHVVVQPGHWFDLPEPPRVAISLLTPPEALERGLERLLAHVSASL